MSGSRSGLSWYLAGAACQFVPFGIHNVLYAWLITVHLGEGGVRLGLAQMCAQLPGLIFILFGGLLADRVDKRRILIGFHCLAALPAFTLIIAIESGHLSYVALIVFAVAVGTFNSFIQPARDSLLNQVVESNLQRAVTLVMGLSFASQIVGYGVASRADALGPIPLLAMQSALLLLGAIFATRLPSPVPMRESLQTERDKVRRGPLAEIGDGLRIIFSSSRMAPVMVLMIAVGVFYSGSFFVLNPLVVRDVYQGAAADIALSYVCFMVGTILTTIVLVAVGGLRRQGLALLLALILGGVCLTFTIFELPFTGYLICIGLWGMNAGVAMSLGRVIIQENAPDEYRARALSIYSLGNLGGMPIGSLMMGYLSVQIGPLQSYMVAVAGVIIVATIVWLTTGLSRVDRLAH